VKPRLNRGALEGLRAQGDPQRQGAMSTVRERYATASRDDLLGVIESLELELEVRQRRIEALERRVEELEAQMRQLRSELEEARRGSGRGASEALTADGSTTASMSLRLPESGWPRRIRPARTRSPASL
jgi:chromosome segregation ATPase